MQRNDDLKGLHRLLKKVEKPARYIGNEVNMKRKEWESVDVHFAFAFPDIYEIGMSYLGLQIIYNSLNSYDDIACERVFTPAVDMEELMREEGVPLFSLENKKPLKDFDLLGFTLQYEMSYTNILNMMDLAGIPIRAETRKGGDYPVIVAGGPCAFNPEPLADFVDLFLIGDGEKLLPQICRLYKEATDRQDFYKQASELDGVYIPSYYHVNYNEDGTVRDYVKKLDHAPLPVRKALIADIDDIEFPENPLVPLIGVVHDRAVVETFRGCTRGCRFCQAGMIYRPVRERSADTILDIAKSQLRSTGHDELSLLSLSTSDHSQFEPMVMSLMNHCMASDVALSLPSLRLDNFSFKVLNEIQKYRKSGLTFAPEAGSQRLRDVINKNITEEDIFDSVRQAISLGWKQIKLYFMIGLPTETYEDLDGIAEIARKISWINREENGGNAGRFNVTVSVSNFVPKPHTPFQWEAQDTKEDFAAKHQYLKEKLRIKSVSFQYHDDATSVLEAVFARGDRRVGRFIETAFKKGCKFDAWTDQFKPEAWDQAFQETGISPDFYATRERAEDEVFPWDIIDSSVSKAFYMRERHKALAGQVTQDCRMGCVGCGINQRTECKLDGFLKDKDVNWKGY